MRDSGSNLIASALLLAKQVSHCQMNPLNMVCKHSVQRLGPYKVHLLVPRARYDVLIMALLIMACVRWSVLLLASDIHHDDLTTTSVFTSASGGVRRQPPHVERICQLALHSPTV
jgi:hypothetical protein